MNIEKRIKSVLIFITVLLSQQVYSQDCDASVVPPAVIDGISITATFSGSVSTYFSAFSSCGYTTPTSSIHLGAAGSFIYTFNFSEPVNNVVFVMTGSGIPVAEEFNFDTDAGFPTINDLGSCFTVITGSTIMTGAGGGTFGGGGIFELYNPSGAYTSFTISGPGGMAGSLFALCENSIVFDEPEYTSTEVTCYGLCDGTATVIDAGDTPYTYLWDADAGGGTAITATDLCEGDYTVEVTGASGEVTIVDVEIIEPLEITGSIISQTNVSCFGGNDGDVIVEAEDGIGTYSYDIGDGSTSSPFFTDLTAGGYTVTITDENDCSIDVPVVIIEPPVLVLSEVAINNITCNLGTDGDIEVIGTGGTGPYTYSIDGVLFTASALFEILTADDYTVTVRDDNGCEITLDFILTEPSALAVTETIVDESCEGECDGSITLVASGGVSPYSYSIDDCASSDLVGMYADLCPGDNSICIEDDNGCFYNTILNIAVGGLAVDATIVPFGPFCIEDDGIALDAENIGVFSGIGVVGGVFDPNVAGVGLHTITNTYSSGCGGVATYDVLVKPMPIVSFSASPLSGCAPVKVDFLNTGDIGSTCEWLFGDGESSFSCASVTHVYENAGDYDISLTVTLDGCSSTSTITDYINVFEVPTANFQMNPSVTTVFESEIDFLNSSFGEDTWEWQFDNLASSSLENPTYVFPKEEGLYDIQLVVYTNNGCSDTITKILTVNQEQLIFVPNVITPDGDSYNEVFKPYFHGIDVYDYHLTIYNRWGETIFESFNLDGGWNGTYGGEIVDEGVYIWHIVTADITTDKKLEYHGHVTVVK